MATSGRSLRDKQRLRSLANPCLRSPGLPPLKGPGRPQIKRSRAAGDEVLFDLREVGHITPLGEGFLRLRAADLAEIQEFWRSRWDFGAFCFKDSWSSFWDFGAAGGT